MTVTTEERNFELIAVGTMKTGFEVTPDALHFAHDIRDTDDVVDLTFDCGARAR